MSTKKNGFRVLVMAGCVLFSGAKLSAESQSTDWLKSVEGSTGDVLGAQVINVVEDSKGLIVDIVIPLDGLQDYETSIEFMDKPEVSKASRREVQKKNWLRDEDNEIQGIRLYVKGSKRFDFRVRLHVPDEMER